MSKHVILTLFLILGYNFSYGTHIRGADLTYKRISDDNFTYEFTLTGFTDTGSPVQFGDGIINFGDGSAVQINLEATSFNTGIFLGQNNETELYRITIVHTYVAQGFYRVSYREPSRNDEIVNINNGNSTQIPFYLEASLVIDPLIGPNDSPVLTTFPADDAFIGKTFTHNPWAWDPDGDSLVYRLLTPLQDHGQVVPNYELPNDPQFYQSPTDWNFANESGDGPAIWNINPFTGDLVWDAPGNLLQNSIGPFSEYSVAFLVEEWRKVEGSWRRIGHVTRDVQIILTGQEISRPDFQIPDAVLLLGSETIKETISFQDPEGEPIKVEYFGEVFDLENSPMEVSPEIGDFTNGPLLLTFEWTPLPEHERARPYYVHLKITDDPVDPELNPSVTYKTWVLSFGDFPDVITGINDIPEKQIFQLYPNPATHIVKWRFPNDQLFSQLIIYNVLGQQTLLVNLTSSKVTEWNVENLLSGLYFVELSSLQGIYRGRFIKR